MSGLLPVDDALKRMLDSVVAARPVVEQPLLEASGAILAKDIKAPIDVPLNDNSAMDGYALRAVDASGPLPVSQRITAGSTGDTLQAGTAARIFTGAEIPPGADAVVMQEDCVESDAVVTVSGAVAVGQNIRPRGQDIAAGATVLRAGKVLLPQDLGLLASIGADRVSVYSPLKVAIMSTGDELREPGEGPLRPGQLFNSNRFTLAAMLGRMNIEVVDCGIVPDNPADTATALEQAAAAADCVISSGGVSVGEEDHVKAQVERLGQLDLWKLAIKPGKPLAFGRVGETPFIGLPGNPTSVFVTFCIVARPYLRKLQGAVLEPLPMAVARAGFSRQKPGGRQEYLRVRVRDDADGVVAEIYDNQSSGVLSSVTHSNALAVIPVGQTVAEGEPVRIVLLDQLLG